MATHTLRTVGTWSAGSVGVAAAAYAALAGVSWLRYGHPAAPAADEGDELLDRFMPRYDVVERQHARIAAPPDVTFAAAYEADLLASPIIRAVFDARALVLGARKDATDRPRGLVPLTRSLGWGVLAEIPGREIVMGTATKPWEADTVFRTIPSDQFLSFDEPGYVKIAWTLRADPAESNTSIFRHETRATATDGAARARFRTYWSFFSPGITLIRWLMLHPLREEAERRAAGIRHWNKNFRPETPTLACRDSLS